MSRKKKKPSKRPDKIAQTKTVKKEAIYPEGTVELDGKIGFYVHDGDGDGDKLFCYLSGKNGEGMVVTKEFENLVFEDIKKGSDLFDAPDKLIAVSYKPKGMAMGYEIHVINQSIQAFFRIDKDELDFSIQNNRASYHRLSAAAQDKPILTVAHLVAFNYWSRSLDVSVGEL